MFVNNHTELCRFLYIENQYFLGSCFMWSDEKDSGCSHTVVAELVQRIVTKIQAGQEFTAYIVRLHTMIQ